MASNNAPIPPAPEPHPYPTTQPQSSEPQAANPYEQAQQQKDAQEAGYAAPPHEQREQTQSYNQQPPAPQSQSYTQQPPAPQEQPYAQQPPTPQGQPYAQQPPAPDQGYAQNPYQQPPAPSQAYPYQQPPAPQGAPQSQPGQPYSQQPPAPPAPPIPQPKEPKKSNKNGCIIAAVIVAVVIAVFIVIGVVACSAISDDIDSSNDINSLFQDNSSMSDEEYNNNYFRTYFDCDTNSKEAITTQELQAIQADEFDDEKAPSKDGYAEGVYIVGQNISAGSYWLYGSNTEISHFFLLREANSNAGDETTYNVFHINTYYGHNIVELAEGDALVVENDDGFIPLNKMKETFKSPYEPGVYRVGTDIPAGTYTVTAGKDKDDLYAVYIMENCLPDDSTLPEVYTNDPNELGTVTLKAGTYVELYNVYLKDATSEIV